MAWLSIRASHDPIEDGSLTSAQYAEFLFQLFELFGDVQLEEWARVRWHLGCQCERSSWFTGVREA